MPFSMVSMEDTPPILHAVLFPMPRCAISQLLSFQFPICSMLQTSTVSSLSEFWSIEPLTILNVAHVPELHSLPMPPPTILDELVADKNHSDTISIVYAHLLVSNPAKMQPYPRWILSYWVELTHLQKFTQGPWLHAESWVKVQTCTWSVLSRCCLALFPGWVSPSCFRNQNPLPSLQIICCPAGLRLLILNSNLSFLHQKSPMTHHCL